jgi:hypothetical protein
MPRKQIKKPFASAVMVLATYLTVWTYSLWANVIQLSAATNEGLSTLAITLLPAKQQFILGEPIPLLFKVTNESNSRVELPGVVGVHSGGVRVRIAFENGPYREYRGPMWALVNVRGSPKLDSGRSIEITATVLHHRAPKRGDLNDQRWERITQETIDTEIALPKAGRYHLKAILFNKIESPPVEIRLTEPQTIDDREVWKFISNQPEYALFMQSGDLYLPGTRLGTRTNQIVDEIERFVNYHSTSTYTPYFRAAIAQYRALIESLRKTGRLDD